MPEGSHVPENVIQQAVEMVAAPFTPLALSFVVDGILVLAVAPTLFSFVPQTGSLGTLPVCLPFLWFYWVWLWSGGRQSLGQFVFRIVSLNSERLPLRVSQVAYQLSLGLIPLLRQAQSPRLCFWRLQQ